MREPQWQGVLGFFEYVGKNIRKTVVVFSDLFALVAIFMGSTRHLAHAGRRRIFFRLLSRQIMRTGVHALYVSGFIAILLGIVLIFNIKEITSGQTFGDAYSHLFLILVVRELAPLISGSILIARSASATTVEIAHLKLSGEFDTLRDMEIHATFLLLTPVFFAFPISMIAMFIYFDAISMLSAFFMIHFLDPSTQFIEFLLGILNKITLQEISVTLLKGVVGGGVIGLLSTYFGSKVQKSYFEVSHAVANANTAQLILFFVINAGLSILAYRG